MPLAQGDQLGHYRIQSLIGRGGMGEVYRALDTKLERDVAIKVLPTAVANDPERLVRFEREAKVLAQLNHPGIAAIHGVEDRALVMELVPGQTLADRISQGPIPPVEAKEILLQIADALEYAHERGVIHRDLKPANIKIDPEDKVKILDFGLAKALTDPALATSAGADDPMSSPTVTMGGTIVGTILGTAAYMAPEQARGKKVDKRADIWAFGVIAWEMLTGDFLFQGEETVQVLSRVLEQPADLERVPGRFRKLLARCLDRNPKDRLRDIGEARFLLAEPARAASGGGRLETRAPQWRVRVGVAAGAILVAAAVVLAFVHFREPAPESPTPVRFLFTPENATVAPSMRFALSPDGTKLAYTATGSEGVPHLWIRSLDTLESRRLSATDIAINVPIFWSFDSRFVVFSTPGKLKKIDVSGGPAQTLCDVSGTPVGGSWKRDGVILFGTGVSGTIMRVSAEGGMATSVTAIDPSREERYHSSPVFLPDERHFLYFRSGRPESTGIYVGSLDDKPGQQPLRRLLATDYSVQFAPFPDGNSGEMLFLREGTLFAQSFDLRRLELSGEPVPVAEHVSSFLANGQFSISNAGALVYRTGGNLEGFQVMWLDRKGKTLSAPSESGYNTTTLALSPDGSRAIAERIGAGFGNLWLLEFARGGKTRFTFSQNGFDRYAAWSPDGTRIAFSSNRGGHFDLYQHAANGAGEDALLLKSDGDKYVDDWSRDGRFLLYEQVGSKTARDLWVLPMNEPAGERKPIPFLQTEFNELEGRFSPDGHWIAYRSNESGRYEIYVRPFPSPAGGGGKWMISQGGANQPRWRRDGKELLYQTVEGQIMAAEVSATGAGFQSGIPKPLFKFATSTVSSSWDVSADGTRFLLPNPEGGESGPAPFIVVLNWMAALKR